MEEKQLNALRSQVRAAVTRANAGLSQTEQEIKNVSQYAPQTNDDLETTLLKAAGLEKFIANEIEGLITDPKEWLETFKAKNAKKESSETEKATKGPLIQVGKFKVRQLRLENLR